MLYLRRSARVDDGAGPSEDVKPPSSATAAVSGLPESAVALGPALAARSFLRPQPTGDGESTPD